MSYFLCVAEVLEQSIDGPCWEVEDNSPGTASGWVVDHGAFAEVQVRNDNVYA